MFRQLLRISKFIYLDIFFFLKKKKKPPDSFDMLVGV